MTVACNLCSHSHRSSLNNKNTILQVEMIFSVKLAFTNEVFDHLNLASIIAW